MRRDTTFKVCIIISACIHIAILIPWSFFNIISMPEVSFQRIELSYFKDGPVTDVLIKDIKPITSVKGRTDEQNIKTAKLKEVKIGLNEKTKKSSEAAKDTIAKISKDAEPEDLGTIEGDVEDGLAYMDYYLRVREKIKSTLEKNGRRFMQEGDIHVRFTITRDGTLKDLMLYKKSGGYVVPLETIAIKSIKDASPFPAFGEDIKEGEIPFDLPIRFTRHP